MLLDMHMKFLEDILNRFQVTEQTRFVMDKVPKKIIKKSINARVRVHAFCRSSNVDWYLYEVS